MFDAARVARSQLSASTPSSFDAGSDNPRRPQAVTSTPVSAQRARGEVSLRRPRATSGSLTRGPPLFGRRAASLSRTRSVARLQVSASGEPVRDGSSAESTRAASPVPVSKAQVYIARTPLVGLEGVAGIMGALQPTSMTHHAGDHPCWRTLLFSYWIGRLLAKTMCCPVLLLPPAPGGMYPADLDHWVVVVAHRGKARESEATYTSLDVLREPALRQRLPAPLCSPSDAFFASFPRS